MKTSTLFHYLEDTYEVTPVYLWEKFPDYAVFRHQTNNKWFALYTPVPANKLGLSGDKIVALLTVKLPPADVDELQESPDFLPAYHMNKTHWLSIRLAEPEDKVIKKLIKESFQLTQK